MQLVLGGWGEWLPLVTSQMAGCLQNNASEHIFIKSSVSRGGRGLFLIHGAFRNNMITHIVGVTIKRL